MERVLTVEETKWLDGYTVNSQGITTQQLIEHAGNRLYQALIQNPELEFNHVLIFAGGGYNGADALVLAKHLLKHGTVDVVICSESLKAETKQILQELKGLTANIHPFKDIQSLQEMITDETLLIDGLVGIGLQRPIEGKLYDLISWMNGLSNPVIAIDIPSGLYGNSGLVGKIAVKADYTYMMQCYKPGNLLQDALDYHGKMTVVDLGMDMSPIQSAYYVITEPDVRFSYDRRHNTHKYDYGSILTIGGSIGMFGAPLLAALAALRTGSGISGIAIPWSDYPYMHSPYPELMIHPYHSMEDLLALLSKRKAVAFGPGLGRKNEAEHRRILKELLQTDLPLVVDADGIRLLSPFLPVYGKRPATIVTPHLGELGQLLQKPFSQIQEQLLDELIQLTTQTDFTYVIKGPTTLVAQKETIYFCPVGNPGMATAGSGDVLTGMITSLLGQGFKALEAALYGVLLHGRAGNHAAKEKDKASLIASDIVQHIPQAMKDL